VMLLMGGLSGHAVIVYVTHLQLDLTPVDEVHPVFGSFTLKVGGTICGEVDEVDDEVKGIDKVWRRGP